MCGITGFFEKGRSPKECKQALRDMTAALVHRGPDAEGFWSDEREGIHLGHRRLSILDLTSTGNQPMASESGRYQLVFNGEIYNFQELRKELAGHGQRFRGSSDTEVMLAAFEHWGLEGSLKKFVGMFAFAVWDREKKSLN